METTLNHDFCSLSQAMVEAMRDNRVDEAEAMFKLLCELDPSCEDLLIFPALIAIQRGQILAALQHINGLPEDRCPEIKALCLNLLGDPLWHGLAMSLVDSTEPYVRKAMRQLLCMPLQD